MELSLQMQVPEYAELIGNIGKNETIAIGFNMVSSM